jgi:Cu-processing system permease protein
MGRIIKFVIQDILKNRIVLFYTLVLAVFSWSIFSLEDNSSKGVLSLLNVILLTVPLVSVIFSTIYIYNSSEFIELLVSQPIKRSRIWWSIFLGLVLATNTAFLIGAGIPIIYFVSGSVGLTMIVAGCFLTTVFTSLAVLASITTRDKAKGIGLAIITWLFFTLIFDGLVLFLMFQFSDYPIEKGMVILSACNPIDLARIMVLLQVDVSALLGYTGAVFKSYFGSPLGLVVSFILLLSWAFIPFLISLKKFVKKDL